jgi:hypothetical protein
VDHIPDWRNRAGGGRRLDDLERPPHSPAIPKFLRDDDPLGWRRDGSAGTTVYTSGERW